MSSKNSKSKVIEAIESFNQFDINTVVQSIWKESTLDIKKQRTIDEVINNFKFKEKQTYFVGIIKQCKDTKAVDKILTNIVLYGEGLNSIKI